MDFDTAVLHILEFEGGLIDHPKDPGGITKYGISLRAFPELGEEGIRSLTKQQAMDIYRDDYWYAAHCGDLPASLRLMVFDCAVNQGVSFAIRATQAAVSVQVDGQYGKRTKAAVQACTPEETLRKVAHNRYYRYRRNKNWETFGDGWMARLLSVSLAT